MIWQIFLLVIFVVLLYKLFQRDKDLPPGEYGWPIVGALPYMKGNLRDFLSKVKVKHGNIFSVRIGSLDFVFLRNLELIKHFNRIELSGRPDTYHFQIYKLFLQGGIISTHGPIWEANRRFALRHLREFGFGKSSKMQVVIQREAEEFIEGLKTKVGEPTEVDHSLNVAALNVIWGLTTGVRFGHKNQMMEEMVKDFYESEQVAAGPMMLMAFFPILVKILPDFVKNNWMKVDQYMEKKLKLHRLLRETIEEHKKTLDESNPRDYIDAYLIEMKERKEMNVDIDDPISNLVVCVHDLFIAGMETTSTTLKWFTLMMAAFPEVQTRVQKELDETLPPDQVMPLVEDKHKFPFLLATIYEVMRYRPITPFSVIHSALENYNMEGYRIPKGTIVAICVEEIHQDPQYWDKPDEFNPDRFLDNDGQLKKLPDAFIPFGYGKRLCLGEAVARMELLMFAGGIVSNFNIRLPEDAEVNLMPETTSFHFNFPHPFKIIFEKRKYKTS